MRRIDDGYYCFDQNGYEIEIIQNLGTLTWTLMIGGSLVSETFETLGELHELLDSRLGRPVAV